MFYNYKYLYLLSGLVNGSDDTCSKTVAMLKEGPANIPEVIYTAANFTDYKFKLPGSRDLSSQFPIFGSSGPHYTDVVQGQI